MRIVLLAALTLLLAAPVATADPPWSAPRDASPAAEFLTAPGIVFATDGSGLLSWSTGEPRRGHLATLRAGGAIVQRGRLGGEVVARPLVRGGKRTVVLTRTRRVTKTFHTRDRLTAIFGTTADPVGRRRAVGGTHEVAGEDQGPAMAVSGNEVAVAWVELLSRERHRYRIAFSRGGRAFSRPQALATTQLPTRDSESIALAYGPGRKLVAAYSAGPHHPVVAVRTRRPGRGFGSQHVLGDRQPLTTLVAASNRIGRVVVAWGSQDSGEEADRPWIVRAALRPGVSFGPAVVLDPGGARAFAPGALAATVSDDGIATVAWTNVSGPPGAETFPLRTATHIGGQPFGAATEVSPNGILGGLAVTTRNHGDLQLLTWTAGGDVFAARRLGAIGAFDPPERVSADALDDRDPAIAAFGAGRPAVLWPARRSATDNRLEISRR